MEREHLNEKSYVEAHLIIHIALKRKCPKVRIYKFLGID